MLRVVSSVHGEELTHEIITLYKSLGRLTLKVIRHEERSVKDLRQGKRYLDPNWKH